MGILQNFKYISQSGVASIFNIVVSIIRVKIIAVLIGTSGVGLIGQLTNLINISTFLSNLGMSTGFIREVSISRSQQDQQRIIALRSTLVVCSIIASLVISIIIFFNAKAINSWLFRELDYVFYIKLLALNSNFIGYAGMFNALVKAEKLIRTLMKLSILVSSVNTVAAILLIYWFNIDGVLYGIIANSLFNCIITGIIAQKYRLLNGIIPSLRSKLLDKKIFALLIKFGVISLITSIALQLSYASVKSIIIQNSGLPSAGIYQAASNISNQYLPVLLTSLGTYLLPHLAEIQSKEKMHKEGNNSLRLILLLAAPMLISFLAFSDLIVQILYSKEFVASGSILSVIIIGDLFKVSNKVLGTMIIAKNYIITWLSVDILYAASLPVFTLILYNDYGILSPAIGYMIAAFLGFLAFLLPLIFKEKFKIEFIVWKLFASIFASLVIVFMAKPYLNLIGLFLICLSLILLILIINIRKHELKMVVDKYLK
ncbi:oligosaccharide flippase family protein [Fulvivirgaceae bacterium BMA12]|uniref:Oligosaccharide flippase family protein n=1 Tax=Agaribacillus aureus TaxID=3051825 RepID=A0ABT8LG30_9BACT|nr:oligosaccharide flippase family protein [Fulvivirgaceae bacterium BMA12]